MAITPLSTDLNIVAALADLPNATSGLTAAQLKAKFDEGPNAIKAYVNNTLIPGIDTEIGGLLPSPQSIYRQAFINGNFDVWQLGSVLTSSGYGPDCWYADLNNANISQAIVGVPTGSRFAARITMTGIGAGNMYQAFESDTVKKLIGKTVTLSIKMRRNASFASNVVLLVQKNATPDTLLGGTWTTISSDVFTSANMPTGSTSSDWYTASVTAVIPSDGTANGIRVFIQQASAQASGAYYEISQAQICAGDTALPFQPKSYSAELADCKRFCHVINDPTNANFKVGFGTGGTTTVALIGVQLPVQMRIVPTLVATAADWQLADGAVVTTLSTVGLQGSQNSKDFVTVRATVASGLTVFRPYFLESVSANKLMIFDARL